MRLFFAILLPDAVRAACERVQADLRAELGDDGIRWTAPAQFHFTLKFLGETAESRLPDVIAAAEEAAAQSSPFTLTVAHLSVLPSIRQPRLIHVCAEEFWPFHIPHLASLVECLDTRLSERGFVPENRGFDPHLTLARVKSPAGFKAVKHWAARELRSVSGAGEDGFKFQYSGVKKVDKIGVFEVQQFVLVSSELRRDGPIYTVLETYPLIAT